MIERLYAVTGHTSQIYRVTEAELGAPAVACARCLSPDSDKVFFVESIFRFTEALYGIPEVQGIGFSAFAQEDGLRLVASVLIPFAPSDGIPPHIFRAITANHAKLFREFRSTDIIPQLRFFSTAYLKVPEELEIVERKWKRESNTAVLAIPVFVR